MRIDRCICEAMPFRRLKEEAEARGAGSVEELQKHVRFGNGCGLCKPYVREMLRTGRTAYDAIIREPEQA